MPSSSDLPDCARILAPCGKDVTTLIVEDTGDLVEDTLALLSVSFLVWFALRAVAN